MIWMFPAVLAAPTADDEALRKRVSASVGKEIPAKYFCVKRPQLPEPFPSNAAAVGIKMKGVGCRLKKVVRGEGLLDPETALPALIGGGAWANLDGDGKKAALLNYTREFLLAFDQPLGVETASVEVKSGSTHVTQPFHQRIAEPMTATKTEGVWVFDKTGTVTKATREGGPKMQTRFLMEDAGTKGLPASVVSESLAKRGKPIKQCYQAAWRRDLTIRAKTRMSWTVADGKASELKARGDGSNALLKCYANGVGQVEFPPDAKGSVDWMFIIHPVDPSAAE